MKDSSLIQEAIFGGLTTAVFSIPAISFSDNQSLQLAGTIFTAVYGVVINFTGADEHKGKSYTQMIPVVLRALFMGGFTGIMAWAFCSHIGLGAYEKLLMGGALGYAGDKGLKVFMNKFLKNNGGNTNG